MKKHMLFVLSLIFFSLSCDDDSSPATIDLIGTQWNLYQHTIIDTGPINIVPETDEDYWIIFNTDGTLSAQDACNLCDGSYSIIADTLNVVGIGCTEAACTGSNWIGAISGVYTTSITNDILVVTRYPDFLMELESYYFVAD
ncbi:MAG: META domain-containing protein [Candidatus Marinimicrobia bacterium]|nr:META domain-containing protein [Candidatus Neomarinimicrobiota bacterium]